MLDDLIGAIWETVCTGSVGTDARESIRVWAGVLVLFLILLAVAGVVLLWKHV